jgi:sensor c-di-GMP phosphodiesterase-like protein
VGQGTKEIIIELYSRNPYIHPSLPFPLEPVVGMVEMIGKEEIAHKVRRVGDHLRMAQNCYVLVLFNLTATETINERVLTALKELREHARMLLNDVDELIKELEQ